MITMDSIPLTYHKHFIIHNFCFLFQQVKLSSKSGQNVDIVWTESGLLITATGEHVVRSVCSLHLLSQSCTVTLCSSEAFFHLILF